MGSFLDTPKKEKEVDEAEGLSLRAGLAAMQGWRVDMEVSGCFRAVVAAVVVEGDEGKLTVSPQSPV